jgi:hypothetical protein
MSHYYDVPSKNTFAKGPTRVSTYVRRPSDAELRASAGRIVDLLQQLVIARPEMIIPLEQIVKGVLANFLHVQEHEWREEEIRLGRRTRLPRMPLSELPALKALLQVTLPTSHPRAPRNTVVKKSMSTKCR